LLVFLFCCIVDEERLFQAVDYRRAGSKSRSAGRVHVGPDSLLAAAAAASADVTPLSTCGYATNESDQQKDCNRESE
jgi:hypothetical protein